jgi:sec-independent protein translocase protein TatB
MFGIGPQELIIIGLLALIVFGPRRLPGMAKEFARFVNEARSTVEDFKDELIPEEVDEARHAIEDIKEKTRQSITGRKPEEEARR